MTTLRCLICDTPLNEDGICPECDKREQEDEQEGMDSEQS